MNHFSSMNPSDVDKFFIDRCPRCRREGTPLNVGEGLWKYPCGTVWDVGNHTITELQCTFKEVPPELGLIEAALYHATYATKQKQIGYSTPDEDDGGYLSAPLPFCNEDADYLLWDSHVFMSVLDGCTDLIGAVVDYGKPMNAVWLFDPAMQNGDGTMIVLSQFIHADEVGLVLGKMLQSKTLTQSPGDMSTVPTDQLMQIVWYPMIKWGEPIVTAEQSAIAALYTWLQQPYIQQADLITHSRQVKRYAEQKGTRLSNIQVIEFRKPDGSQYRSAVEDPASTRELHCCFERTGHLRRQWYPKSKAHKPVWIAPTLVGDPEKPFKPKGQTLYRVRK